MRRDAGWIASIGLYFVAATLVRAAGVSYIKSELATLPADLAAKATVLVDTTQDPGDLRVAAKPEDGRGSVVAAADQSFGKAIHVEVNRRTSHPWDVQLMTPPIKDAIHKGDVLLVALRARCSAAQSESGGGQFDGAVQLSESPWTPALHVAGRPGAAWQAYYSAAIAEADLPAEKGVLSLHLGMLRQSLDVGGLYILNFGPGIAGDRLPYTRVTYEGRDADAPWRVEAEKRIEKYRKGDLTVRVVDAAGKPVAGAAVHVRLRRHAYGFGSFLEGPALSQTPDGQKYREWFDRLFNRGTSPVYWADWGWSNPRSREQYLQIAQWAKDQDLQVRGHNLIWPSWRNMPKSMRQYEHDPVTLRAKVLEHIREVVTECRTFNFREYDVMNEPRAEHDLMDLLGPDVMVDWYKTAHDADPRPLLGVNEYQILSGGGETEPQQETYARTIQYLLDHGAPLGVIGFQSHMSENLTPPARVVQILDRFAKFGLPLQATEYDLPIGDEQAQADYQRDFLIAFFSQPATTAFTMWGFWEGQQWQPRAALIRKDWTLKLNGEAYLKLVTQTWWTDVNGATAADGSFHARGFLGDYDITVTHGHEKPVLVRSSLDKAGTIVTAGVRN